MMANSLYLFGIEIGPGKSIDHFFSLRKNQMLVHITHSLLCVAANVLPPGELLKT